MESKFYPASQRGFANHGWLKATHSFSFANYHDSEKIHFGKLRVLNDDVIAPSKGFDLHPHQDMEIITIPLSGSLLHGDNMGNHETITAGEVQVMSAGTGIWHSEFNASETDVLSLFQIWIFSDKNGHKPRYEQQRFDEIHHSDQWQLFVGPKGNGNSLWINQDAFISTVKSVEIEDFSYAMNRQANGVYFMLIDGKAEIGEQQLERRDAVGFWEVYEPLKIKMEKNSQLLAIEVPMR